jgi:hypothetical protein
MAAQYEERYCAFVDILGFRELMAGLRGGAVHYETIRDLLRRIHSPYDPQIVDFEHCDFRAQSISDAVALSTKRTIPGLSMLCRALRELSLAALHAGYFTRGALCKGSLYHDETMVFGEALVKAYQLESEIVRFPRIMLTKDVVDDAVSSDKKDEFAEHVKQADDGPYFLHVLWQLHIKLEIIRDRSFKGEEPDLSYYAAIRRMIQRRFLESVDTPRHFEKVQWFARYWNDSIIRIRSNVDRISGPGLDEKAAAWGP